MYNFLHTPHSHDLNNSPRIWSPKNRYHSWEHYSSIRNINGPHEGLPEISPKVVPQNPLAKLTKKDPPRPIEKQIMKMTDETDLEVVRELLDIYKGNFDEVVGHIFEKAYKDEHGDEEDDKGETPETGDKDKDKDKESESEASKDKFESDAAAKSNESIAEDKSKKGLADTDTTGKDASPDLSPSPRSSTASPAPSSPSKEARPDTPPPEPAKGIVPKKRMSGRDKKEQAKRNQKLNRKNKGKVESSSSENSPPSTTPPSRPSGGSASSPGSMRELFV